MLVINLNSYPVQAKIDTSGGSDFIHLAAKGRVTLPPGASINANWLALNTNIKVVGDSTPTIASSTDNSVNTDFTPVENSKLFKSGAK